MEKLGYECKCLGGGKIEHNSKDKKIRVFGLSTVSAAHFPSSASVSDAVGFLVNSLVAFGNLRHILNIGWKTYVSDL